MRVSGSRVAPGSHVIESRQVETRDEDSCIGGMSGATASINSGDQHDVADLSSLAAQLDGVAERRRNGLLEWRYRGRLVARQLDHSHVVIRTSFDFRDLEPRNCARSRMSRPPPHIHGEEGADGSSPSEGLVLTPIPCSA
jgi:hypothetical protein